MKTTTKKDVGRFLTSASTFWVTIARLGLILMPHLVSSASFMKWFYNPFVVSVLIRPHQSLPQLEEAHAIRALASDRSPTDFAGFYDANDSIRIPPIALAVFSKFMDATKETNFGLWLSLFLLLVDILVSYLMEQIGIRLLDSAFSSRSSNGGGPSSRAKNEQSTEEEEETQKQLLERVRPPFAHIFPICSSDEDASERSPSSAEGSLEINERDTQQQIKALISRNSLPLLSAQLYYWSPFTALPSSLLYCWQNIAPLFLVASIYESICSCSSEGSLSVASFYLAVATYLEPRHIVYLVPITLLSSFTRPSPKCGSKTTKSAVFVAISFIVWSLLFHGTSCSIVGLENYWRILGTVYGNTWLTTSPNLSLQWYFRMQIFSRFRDYFGAIFAGIPFIVIGPLCLRFFQYPGVLVSPLLAFLTLCRYFKFVSALLTFFWLPLSLSKIASFTMIAALYRPVQVLYDANFALCFFLFCPRSLARMGYAAFVALVCLWVPLILNVVDHWMWMDANNGNANYMFFQCLAYNVFLGIVLAQFVSASMQHDKALRLEREMRPIK